MKKWLGGLITGVFLVLFLIVAGGILAWQIGPSPPDVSENTTLILELGGDIPEQAQPNFPEEIFGAGRRANFLGLLQDIQKAGADSRITGIVVKPSNLRMGWGKLQQLRRALEQFQQRGKTVVGVLTVAGNKEYFLATVASRIFLSPAGFLDLKGMRAEVMFFKDTLAKVGIQADLEHIGDYKNFSDQFTDNRMSRAFREATTSLLDSIYGNFVETVAAARQRSVEEFRSLMEQSGPFESERALLLGLADQLLYEDQVFDQLKRENQNEEFHKMEMEEYRRVPASQVGLDGEERIAVVYAVGNIIAGEGDYDPLASAETLGARTMAKVLESVRDDDSIKGVVLRIDSPGGDALASDEIWRCMILLREKKPVVISMSDTAASGGYHIAMTGDPIVAEEGTITGSIGIVAGKLNLKGFYDKVGIHKEIISRGDFARMDSDYDSYTPRERERVRTLMKDLYDKFLARVSAARNMTPEAVDQLAQGRVWTGEQAQQNGLIDELGGFDRALELLKEKAGISPETPLELVEYPKGKSLFQWLLSRVGVQALGLPAGLTENLSQWRRVERIAATPLLAWMPYVFEFL